MDAGPGCCADARRIIAGVATSELIWIRSEQDERTRVGIAYERPSFDPYLADLRVRVETDRLEYEGRLLVSEDADGLAAYLTGLVDDRRGWSGTRRWEALEHGMSIFATHQGRRGRARVRRPPCLEARRVGATGAGGRRAWRDVDKLRSRRRTRDRQRNAGRPIGASNANVEPPKVSTSLR
jgi:hypothetical protein